MSTSITNTSRGFKPAIYSYILKIDNGAAPNPFWGRCTLTICKPAIRRTARVGDWIIGTGSKNTRLKDNRIHDLSQSIVYAMKVTEVKSLKEYDAFCKSNLPEKFPNWFSKDWRRRMGDCIYDFSNGAEPEIRKGVHKEKDKPRDISGRNALISNHFYYFGEEPRPIPRHLKSIIKKNQGHLRIVDPKIINAFNMWIKKFKRNKLYADPQLRYMFDVSASVESVDCGEDVSKGRTRCH